VTLEAHSKSKVFGVATSKSASAAFLMRLIRAAMRQQWLLIIEQRAGLASIDPLLQDPAPQQIQFGKLDNKTHPAG
jgi:hypothetical protein